MDIIKHPMETDGKSTSSHAAILAPDNVTIHTYPCIPEYDTDKVSIQQLCSVFSYSNTLFFVDPM